MLTINPKNDRRQILVPALTLDLWIKLPVMENHKVISNVSATTFTCNCCSTALNYIQVLNDNLRIQETIPQVSMLQAAMPTLVTGSLLADEYKLNPQLANMMVGLGIFISFLSTAFWWYIIIRARIKAMNGGNLSAFFNMIPAETVSPSAARNAVIMPTVVRSIKVT